MKSISQTTQQMESISKKTSAFFRRYPCRPDSARGQRLQAQRIFLHSRFPRARKHHLREPLALHATPASRGIPAVWQGHGLPLLELLSHELAQVHAAPCGADHQRNHQTVDRRRTSLRYHRRRFALQPLALQARGTLGERLRPCEPPLYEGLPPARPWLDGWEHLPAAHVLPPFDIEGKESSQRGRRVRRCQEQRWKAAQARADGSACRCPQVVAGGQSRWRSRAIRPFRHMVLLAILSESHP